MKALLFDLDETLVASDHLDRHRRTRDYAGLQAALPTLRAPEGLPEVLAELVGEVQLGVVTTSPKWYARTVLGHVYPDVRWRALVTYGDVQARKPDPEGLMLALRQLGLASARQAAYIGDQDHDLEAARRAGMQPIRATWCGARARADDERVLAHPRELTGLLAQNVTAVPSAATRQLLVYSRLSGVGRKTLLALLPDLAAGRRPSHPRVDAALTGRGEEEDVWAQAETQVQTLLDACRTLDIQVLSPLDASYPAALQGTGTERPAALFVRGQLPSGQSSIAVIGTRDPTPHGLEITRRISAHFASRGHSVVSGLALGVDTAAHEAALGAGGHTVAVLAHGLHTIAPRQNRDLAARILAQGGALVSEYAPGTEARPPYFAERDRIQAGLSRATVLIQSDLQGGSWHACKAALRYGRPLAYPVPTAHDVQAQASKIAGLQLLETGTEAERRAQLQCGPEALENVFRIAGRGDYPRLEAVLAEEQRPGEGQPVEMPTLFGG